VAVTFLCYVGYANLLGQLDTDIVFDYRIFTPACRQADLADIQELHLKIDRRWHICRQSAYFPAGTVPSPKLWAAVNASNSDRIVRRLVALADALRNKQYDAHSGAGAGWRSSSV
jgi:hypothetical protein